MGFKRSVLSICLIEYININLERQQVWATGELLETNRENENV
jgi:hypothetical protein